MQRKYQKEEGEEEPREVAENLLGWKFGDPGSSSSSSTLNQLKGVGKRSSRGGYEFQRRLRALPLHSKKLLFSVPEFPHP